MKEYRKWLKGKAGIGWYTGTEEGWKAALEMVLKEEYNYDRPFNKRGEIASIYDIIREELKDERI